MSASYMIGFFDARQSQVLCMGSPTGKTRAQYSDIPRKITQRKCAGKKMINAT